MKKIQPWQNKFYSKIISRGRGYYQLGYVHDMRYTDQDISARVGGQYFYNVNIHLNENGKILSMYCDCPFARDGNNCKHEAALLFAYEARSESEARENKKLSLRVKPFEKDFAGKHYYYDLNRITENLVFNKDKVEKAKRLIENKQIILKDIGTCYLGEDERQALFAEVGFKGSYGEDQAYAYIYKDRVDSYGCQGSNCHRTSYVSRFYNYFGQSRNEELCEHVIAAFLFLGEHILNYDPGDMTDRASMAFLDRFSLGGGIVQRDETAEKKPLVKLQPKLDYNGKGILKLGFRIGNDKYYVVKDFKELCEKYQKEAVLVLGVKNALDFSRLDFDDSSKVYYDFINETLKEEETRTQLMYNDYTNQRIFAVDRDILLYGKRLDEFYDLVKDRSVEMHDRSGRGSGIRNIGFADGQPRTALTISERSDMNGFAGVSVYGQLPELIMGAAYGYFLKDDTLYRTSSAYAQMIASMKQDMEKEDLSLHIGKKQLSRFYHHVLPKLREEFEVFEDNKEHYESRIPPKPSFSFYFDVSEGLIICKALVAYGEKEYFLYDGKHDAMRDYISEKEAYELISGIFHDRSDNGDFFVEAGDDPVFEIIEELLPSLMKIGEVHSTKAFDRLKVKRSANVSVGVRIDNGLLQLDVQSEDIDREELAAIITSYRLKKKYHRLKSGELIRMDDENIEALDEILQDMGISLKDFVKGKMHLPAYRALYLDKILEANESIYDERDAYFTKLVDDFKNIRESEDKVPESLEEIMRPYQKYGFQWLKTLSRFSFGGILADEMGLGKTIQVLSLLLDNKDREGGTSLVVCPASLVYNWLSEVKRFTPELKAAAVAGSQKERAQVISAWEENDILITSYDLLKRDIDLYEDKVFAFEILDEAQYIKTYTTANAKSCKAIRAKGRFALTGTPIENNLSELWSIFDFLMPGFLYRYEEFKDEFETRIVKEEDQQVMERLKNMIAPFILRRKKADVLSDLPDKIEETIKVKMEEKQRRLYDSQVLKISNIVGEDETGYERNKIAVLAELMKLRQICCEPSLIYDDFDGESAKSLACMEMVRNAIEEGHKILLFSQFTSMLEIIEEDLKKEGIRYYKIEGKTKKEDRLAYVEAFNEDDVPLFLISLKAGGTGLNLTGADIVIHYDPWWNLAAQNQATDRAHRIGQKKVVTVYKIIAQDTIEEKIVDLQEKKMQLADSILSTDSVSLASLGRDELLALLK